MTAALIFSIEEFSVFDGPGIRTTVFLKGCPLRCEWCHNPEGQSFSNSILRATNGCIGCGDCAKVCVSHAICMENGIARVDTRRCVGCGLCAKECPKKIISMIPQEAATAVYCNSKDKGADARKACKNACIGCKKCEKTCPEHAISVINNCAVIDYTKCPGCGLCAECCPTACLKKVTFPDLPENFKLN